MLEHVLSIPLSECDPSQLVSIAVSWKCVNALSEGKDEWLTNTKPELVNHIMAGLCSAKYDIACDGD